MTLGHRPTGVRGQLSQRRRAPHPSFGSGAEAFLDHRPHHRPQPLATAILFWPKTTTSDRRLRRALPTRRSWKTALPHLPGVVVRVISASSKRPVDGGANEPHWWPGQISSTRVRARRATTAAHSVITNRSATAYSDSSREVTNCTVSQSDTPTEPHATSRQLTGNGGHIR